MIVMNCSLLELMEAGQEPDLRKPRPLHPPVNRWVQRLGRPSVAGMTETVRQGGAIKDAFRIGTGADAPWWPLLVHGQMIPQKIWETLDAPRWRRENKHIRSAEKRFPAKSRVE
jgi:hypothetical protein